MVFASRAMLWTRSWDKELCGDSIDIDFNLLSGSWEVELGVVQLSWSAFGGRLTTLKLAVNAKLLWGNCIPAMKNGPKKSGQTTGNRFETAENYY